MGGFYLRSVGLSVVVLKEHRHSHRFTITATHTDSPSGHLSQPLNSVFKHSPQAKAGYQILGYRFGLHREI